MSHLGSRLEVSSTSEYTGEAMDQDDQREPSRKNKTNKKKHFDPSDILKVKFPRNYSGAAEMFEKPKVLGSYSIDQERDFGHDKSLLNFLARKYLPEDGEMKVEMDLNKGVKKFNRYAGNVEESFENLLKWIVYNKDRIAAESSQRLDIDFIGMKGNFVKVMRTPYDYSSWTFWAKTFKGSVYIRNEARASVNIPNVDLEKIEIWGHTFEHYMRGGDPEDGVDANEDYRCVLKTKIGGTSLLYAPGMDCVDPEQYVENFEDLDAFLLVKSCREISSMNTNFKKNKLGQWWVENQLTGIPRTIVGYRNDAGIVHTLKLLQTDDLPELAGGHWDPNVSFNFLVRFLQFVKERVNQVPGDIYKFHREEKGYIYCTKLSEDEAEEVNFIPSWYTQTLFAEEESDEDSV